MTWKFCVLVLFTNSKAAKLKNGKLELETDFDFEKKDYFDSENMAHLNAWLENTPLREPNKQVRRKMLDRHKQKEVETVTGWSCNFERGLCDGWKTISEMVWG